MRNLALFLCTTSILGAATAQTPKPAFALRQARQVAALSPSLIFEPNQGQTSPDALWLGRTASYQLFVTHRELVLKLDEGPSHRHSVLRFNFGPMAFRRVEGRIPSGGQSNYFLGDQPSKWHTHIPHYRQLHITGVAPGIDLSFYGAGKQFEYDFIVQPGADPSAIEISIAGAKSLSTNSSGDLEITTHTGALLTQRKPVVYQQIGSRRVAIPASYLLSTDNKVRFRLASYDRTLPLVIDPILSYSTFLGGSGFETANNDGIYAGLAIDSSGAAYISGSSNSIDYPVVGTLYTDPGDNDTDAVVTKLSPDGTQIVYSTYLGGVAGDYGGNIAVDSTGSAYVTGYTFANNFPTVNPIHGDRNHREAFVTRIAADGSSLIYSTYLGGDNDDRGSGIAVDAAGNAYVTGTTYSSDFPTLNAYQPARSSIYSETFLSKITPSGALSYSTYFGGSSWDDFAYGVAVDSAGCAYIVGSPSTNIPVVNPIQGLPQGSADAFIAKFSDNGQSLLFSTYYGGSADDRASDVKVDASGNIYVSGVTGSANFPLVNSAQSFGGVYDAFVLKFNQATNTVVYSMVFGGTSSDDAYTVAIDGSGNAYFGGATSSTDLPLVNSLYADQANEDGYIAKVGPNGGAILFSTYFGGAGAQFFQGSDRIQKLAVDAVGNIYAMGTSNSTINFPLLNPIRSTNQQNDLFVAKLAADIPPAVTLSPASATLLPAAGSGSITVTASIPSTIWSATSNAAWLTITAPVSPITGNGTINYSYTDNPGPGQRSASITVAGVTFSVVQGAPSYTLSPVTINAPANASNQFFTVATSPATASWTATTSSAWISIVSPTSTTSGNSTVTLSLIANPFGTPRSGQVTVAGSTVTVTQAANPAISVGTITTITGNGVNVSTGDGGLAVNAQVNLPAGLALDPSGNLYIAVDDFRIRRIAASTGIITTAVGTGVRGNSGDGGPATAAQTHSVGNLSMDSSGNLLLADIRNGRIRRVNTSGIINLLAGTSPFGYGGDGGPAVNATLYFPFAATLGPDGYTYIADYGNHRIRRVDPNGIITTYAGTGTCGFSGDGGPASAAQFCYPYSVTFDPSGNMIIADTINHRIRRITPAGIVSTIAGNGASTFAGDGGPATAASFFYPTYASVDSNSNIYVADSENNRIRMINASGIIGTIVGTGTRGYNGDNINATSAHLSQPGVVIPDSAGNLYISDSTNHRVRKVTFSTPLPVPIITITPQQVSYNGSPQPVTATVTGTSGENLGPATVTYSPGPGVPTNIGSYVVTASWPGNANYQPASITATYTITKATPIISVNNATVTYNGSPQPVTGSVTGIFNESLGSPVITYNGSATAPTNAGTYTISASYPGSTNYLAYTAPSLTYTILKATPVVSWPAPAAIAVGTPLSSIQLNAAASFNSQPLAGAFVYTPPSGTVLPVGIQPLSAVFNPADTTNFNSVTTPNSITVLSCTFSFKPTSDTVGGAAGSGSTVVTTQAGCPITPSSSAPWLTTSVTGNTVNYSYTVNNTGATRTASITLPGATFSVSQQALSVSLTFNTVPVNLSFIVNGTTYNRPKTLTFTAGSVVPISAISPQAGITGVRYTFGSWSQGGAASQNLTVPTSDTTFTVNYTTEYQLTATLVPSVGGTVSGAGWYAAGSTATLTAVPAVGYTFNNYSGAISTTTSPATVLMDAPKSVTATFYGPPTLQGTRSNAANGTPSGYRNWTLSVTNTSTSPAYLSTITSYALTQTAGPACMPAVLPSLPAAPNLGTINPGATADVVLSFNFSACNGQARFSLSFGVSATDFSTTVNLVNLQR